MAFESTKATIKQNKLVATTIVEFTKDLGEEKIDNILSVSGKSRVLRKEINDKLTIYGKTKLDVNYVENGELKNGLYDMEFSKVVDKDLTGDELVLIKETRTSVVNKEIRVAVTIELFGENINIIPELKLDDANLFVRTEESEVANASGIQLGEFNLTNEYEEQGMYSVIDKRAEIADVKALAGVDSYTVEGNLDVYLTLFNGEVKEIKKTIEFKQELAFTGLLPNEQLIASLRLANFMANVEAGEEKTNIIVTADVESQAFAVFFTQTKQLIDVYSTTNMLETNREVVEYNKKIEKVTLAGNKEFVIDVSDENLAEQLLYVNEVNFKEKNVELDSGKLVITGDVTTNVVYYNENKEVCTKKQNFEITMEGKVAANHVRVMQANANCTNCKIRFGKQIEIAINAEVDVLAFETDYLVYITEVAEKEPLEKDNSPITVYVAVGGEDLFDVGKALKVDPEQIKLQNKLGDQISAKQKIFVYNKIV